MKKLTVLITSTILILLLFGGFEAVQADPPPIPSSFYGEVQFASGDFAPIPDVTQIAAYTDGGVTPVATATITQPGTALIYAINVPGNTTNPQPTTVIFKIGPRIVATAPWVSGTNVSLDIQPPYPDAGGPYVGVAGEAIQLSASVAYYGRSVIDYAWDLDDDGSFDDAVGSDPMETFTAGVHPIGVKATDSQAEGFDQTDVIAVEMSGLTGQVYDGTTKSVTVNNVSPYTTLVTYAGSESEPTNAGTYAVEVAVKDGATTIGTITGYDLVIDPSPITVTADAKTKVYGEADPALTYQVTSGSLVDGDSFTGTLTRNAGEWVGTHTIIQGTLSAGNNYNLTFVSANLTITKKPISVTADPQSKIYGNADPALTFQITSGSLVGGDIYTGNLVREIGEDVATYAITQGTLNFGGNYNVTFIGANLTITPRPITVTADAKSKVFGSMDPALTYTHTGTLVAGDGFSGVLSREPGEPIGVYAILQSTLTLGSNYTITFVSASFTITPEAHVIDLAVGWNLVSFSLTPVSTDIEDVLSSIDGSYILVYAWDASGAHSTSNWMRYDPSTSIGNTLATLDPSMGFWINMSVADTLSVAGSFETSTIINLLDDVGGWNLVGFPSSGSVSMPQALEDNGVTDTDYRLVYAYHATAGGDNWKIYDTGAPDFANDLVNMEPGFGYWIYVTSDPIWTVSYQQN